MEIMIGGAAIAISISITLAGFSISTAIGRHIESQKQDFDRLIKSLENNNIKK